MTPEEPLSRLWEEYAAGLDAESATRFRQDVLEPFQSGGHAAVRAVAAWFAWRPQSADGPTLPSPDELARLRDGLTELLGKLTPARSTKLRWFPLPASPEPIDPAAVRLLNDCRDALDALARPTPPRSRGVEIAAEADRLLASAPDDWLPAAPVRCAERAAEFETLTGPSAEAKRLIALAHRLLVGDRPSTAETLNAAADATARLDGPAERADRALGCLRQWTAAFGVELLPRSWSFAAPATLDALHAESVEVAAVYRPADPVGSVIRVKAFGFAVDGEVVRPAVVSVSAGPAPAGLVELEDVVKDADHPAARAVREQLRGWRAASLGGTIETAAVELFVEYWDVWRAQWDVGAFADRLTTMLHDAFGLTTFYPTNFQDYSQGWVQVVGGGRMTSGRVREVLRPGLADRAGELRVPARVSVE